MYKLLTANLSFVDPRRPLFPFLFIRDCFLVALTLTHETRLITISRNDGETHFALFISDHETIKRDMHFIIL